MHTDDYRPTLKILTAQRRKLVTALFHSTHQLRLYVGPKDTATLQLIKEHENLVRLGEKTLRYEAKHYRTHRKSALFFQPIGITHEKKARHV